MCIIIMGGGITGSTLALAISNLSNGNIPVHIVEKYSLNKIKNNKTIALSSFTCEKLLNIDLWNKIKKYSTPINKIFVYEKNNFGSMMFSAKDHSFSSLGYVVELNKMNQILFDMIKKSKSINFYCPDKICKIIRNNNNITVILNSGKIINGKLLILASGNNDKALDFLNIIWKVKKYKQFAVVTTIKSKLPHNNCAFEIFTKNGLIALLPISTHTCSIVWCLPLSKKNQVMNWSDNDFLYQFQLNFGWKLGKFIDIKKRYYYPLILREAKKIIYNRIILTGNIAQTLHPIAGQGLNIGIRDATILAEILVNSYFLKIDIGNISVLEKYRYKRKLDRICTIKITDGLIDLFNSKKLPIIIGRNFGLNFINNFKYFKILFLKKMMGFF